MNSTKTSQLSVLSPDSYTALGREETVMKWEPTNGRKQTLVRLSSLLRNDVIWFQAFVSFSKNFKYMGIM